jgi:hypothetical protein
VVNPSTQEAIAMKKLSVLILVAILGLVLWALPAGAEKIRLTDAELDGITAGVVCGLICVPPPNSVNGIAGASVDASLLLNTGVAGGFAIGGATPKGRGNIVNIMGQGTIMSPVTGSFRICGTAFGKFFGVGNCP